jgi:hypothetical protein
MAAIDGELYPTLLAATRQALIVLRDEHPDERLYAFGLFTSPGAEYVTVTANSEEGLKRRSGGMAMSPLRWSPCDWEYHDLGEGPLWDQVANLLPDYSGVRLPAEQMEAHLESVFDTCIQVLRDLDAEGLFGEGPERERIVLNLWMGDQGDDERLELASLLNPPSVCQRFAREMEICEEWPPEEELP